MSISPEFAGMMGKELCSLSVAKWPEQKPGSLGPSLLLQQTSRKLSQHKSSEMDRLDPWPASTHVSTPYFWSFIQAQTWENVTSSLL